MQKPEFFPLRKKKSKNINKINEARRGDGPVAEKPMIKSG